MGGGGEGGCWGLIVWGRSLEQMLQVNTGVKDGSRSEGLHRGVQLGRIKSSKVPWWSKEKLRPILRSPKKLSLQGTQYRRKMWMGHGQFHRSRSQELGSCCLAPMFPFLAGMLGMDEILHHEMKPWLKPLLVGVFSGIIRHQGFLGGPKWISQPSTVSPFACEL